MLYLISFTGYIFSFLSHKGIRSVEWMIGRISAIWTLSVRKTQPQSLYYAVYFRLRLSHGQSRQNEAKRRRIHSIAYVCFIQTVIRPYIYICPDKNIRLQIERCLIDILLCKIFTLWYYRLAIHYTIAGIQFQRFICICQNTLLLICSVVYTTFKNISLVRRRSALWAEKVVQNHPQVGARPSHVRPEMKQSWARLKLTVGVVTSWSLCRAGVVIYHLCHEARLGKTQENNLILRFPTLSSLCW